MGRRLATSRWEEACGPRRCRRASIACRAATASLSESRDCLPQRRDRRGQSPHPCGRSGSACVSAASRPRRSRVRPIRRSCRARPSPPARRHECRQPAPRRAAATRATTIRRSRAERGPDRAVPPGRSASARHQATWASWLIAATSVAARPAARAASAARARASWAPARSLPLRRSTVARSSRPSGSSSKARGQLAGPALERLERRQSRHDSATGGDHFTSDQPVGTGDSREWHAARQPGRADQRADDGELPDVVGRTWWNRRRRSRRATASGPRSCRRRDM